MSDGKPIKILMVDDNPGDARLTREAMKEVGLENRFQWLADGDEAMNYLRKEAPFTDAVRPDLILLDLNLPRKDGREVLAEIKSHQGLRRIPVIILTTSREEKDISTAYDLRANSYLNKPVTLDQFIEIVRAIKSFWFNIACLPSG